MTTNYAGLLEKGGGRLKKLVAVSATVLFASAILATPSWAQVINEPPELPHEVVIFPERDFVVADGYDANTSLNFTLKRNGVVIGTASGTTDGAGFLEVNHPGGVCWNNFTPNILPEDVVEVTNASGDGDRSRTANVTAEAAEIVGTDVVIHGTAQNADGSQIPIDLMEQRIVQPAFRDTPGSTITRRDIRATSDGAGEGSISYDAPGSNNWTATYSGLNAVERDLAVDGQTRILSWLDTNAAGDRLGITIYEVGELGGPGFGGCPATADYAVTDAGRDAVNIANVGNDLVLSGVSQDASEVSVSLDDQDTATAAVTATATLSPGAGAQTWSATIPAAQVGGLSDGTLTATGTYTVSGTDIGGVNLKLQKDVVAPAKPTATPGPGRYDRAQRVTLSTENGAKAHYTVNGSVPTANSRVFNSPIPVTATQTIRSIAVDAAGNPSQVAGFRFTILKNSFVSINRRPVAANLGNRVLIQGRVFPAHAGERVRLTINRPGPDLVKNLRIKPNGKYVFSYKANRVGRHFAQARFLGDADHAPSTSVRKGFIVRR